jgi:hypothetical protein
MKVERKHVLGRVCLGNHKEVHGPVSGSSAVGGSSRLRRRPRDTLEDHRDHEVHGGLPFRGCVPHQYVFEGLRPTG